MSNPKFRANETVYIERSLSIPAGAYIIVRAMPEEKGMRSYRVRRASDTTEWVVSEVEIKKVL